MMDSKPENVAKVSAWFDCVSSAAELETCANSFATAVGLLAENVSRLDGRCELRDLEALVRLCSLSHGEMQKHCAELGIGEPQPETTTEGAPATAVDVGGDDGLPEDSKCPKCSAEMQPVLYCRMCHHWPDYLTRRGRTKTMPTTLTLIGA